MTSEKENCIFCRIINGEIPCAKVYEDEHTIVFLDIAPICVGHCLVVPKCHTKNVLDFDADMAGHLFKAIQTVAPAIMKATDAQGFHVLQNNFAAAGQTVFHAHWHIIPRREGDNLFLWKEKPYENEDVMREVAANIVRCV